MPKMCSLRHLDVPDPVLRLLVVIGLLDVEDYVGVVLLAGLHFAEDDVPYANLGGLLLDRVDPILRCYSLDGVESAGVVRLDQGPHRFPRGRVENGAARIERLPNHHVSLVPKAELKLPLLGGNDRRSRNCGQDDHKYWTRPPHQSDERRFFFVSRHGTIAVHATGYLRCYSLSARAFEASAAAASAVAASAPAVAAQFVFLLLQPKRKRPTLVHRMPFPVRLARFRCR